MINMREISINLKNYSIKRLINNIENTPNRSRYSLMLTRQAV